METCTAQPVSSGLDDFAWILESGASSTPRQIAINPENVANGLGKLVLTLVELIRQLLEKQAIRRMEGGTLTDTEVERLGVTFQRLSEQVLVLKKTFGLEGEELNIDLGPLGKLI
jgi:hypothetical protein